MSLLMDALKRAEKERELNASNDKGTGRPRATELSLDPLESERALEDTGRADRGGSARPIPNFEDDREPALSVDDLFELELELQPGSPLEDSSPSLAGLEGLPFRPSDDVLSLEDTSATMPSMKGVQASVDRYFDGSSSASLSMSMPMDIPPPTVGDDTTVATRRFEDTGAQRAAQVVFDAKTLPGKRRSAAGVWLLIASLIFVGLFAGGYYSFDKWRPIVGGPSFVSQLTTTTTTSVSSTTSSSTSAKSGTASTDPVTDNGADFTVVQSDVSKSVEQTIAALDVPPAGDLSPNLEPEPAPVKVQTEPELEPVVRAEPQIPAMTEREFAAALEEVSQDIGTGFASSSAIKISVNTKTSNLDRLVGAGYKAYTLGSDREAAEFYYQALELDANSRDALLGLGALATRHGRWGAAAEAYVRLLNISPGDSVAQSALIALQDNFDPIEGESQIKILLEREPDASYLHFSLGNLYANQSRWPEAQGAFFNAYSLDTENPDYAFNLAVGLDHLTQNKAALTYYQRALDLAELRPSALPVSGVLERIRILASSSGNE